MLTLTSVKSVRTGLKKMGRVLVWKEVELQLGLPVSDAILSIHYITTLLYYVASYPGIPAFFSLACSNKTTFSSKAGVVPYLPVVLIIC